MANIELRGVEKKFGDVFAVKPLDLTIKDGEFIVLLGPSGCGKTTTLRMISGLEAVTVGQILLDGRDVTWLHPSERDIAFVFQFFALYSHMSARDNIAFPLQAAGMARHEVKERVAQVAALLRIDHILDRKPGALSGGDQQRVALARALVRRPAAFLMDEPLGALDAEFRETMRAEIKKLHLAQHATTVYVTHDQIEAMAMGDRIVIMSAAVVQQVGTPTEVYHNPANLFVARFIGSPGMNLVKAKVEPDGARLPGGGLAPISDRWRRALEGSGLEDGSVVLGFRPEAVQVHDGGALRAGVYADDLHGGYTMLHLELADGEIIHGRAARDAMNALGSAVRFDLDPDMMRFFNPETEMAILS
ncbi:MAG: ABC transporter ATP-binding protein [Anaerolineae bacterium]|nr:ABC transporter ATP-binding protein [Anaerolineae bacterium]NUQ02947.1 ABC transporter ATP-binding protein [Anaerolineae bacterium]